MFKINLIIIILSWLSIAVAESLSPCLDSVTAGDYNKALQVCEKQLESVELNQNKNIIVSLYLQLVDIHHALGNSELEDYYLAKTKNHPYFLQSIVIQYDWNRKIGQKYYLLNQYLEAKSHLNQGLTIAIAEKNKDWMSKSYNDMGLVENKLENYQSAMSYFQKSLSLKIEIGDLYKIGTTLNNLGLVHKQLEEYDKSTSYYEQALDTFLEYTQLENFDKRVSHNISHLYEDLSTIYIESGNIEKANAYADKILNTFELKFSPHDQARALINLAKLQIVKGDYEKALLSLEKAQLQNDFSIEIYYEFTKIYLSLNEAPKAIQYAQLGLNLALQNQHALSMDFYKLLSDLYKSSDFEKAFMNLDEYQKLREEFISKKYNSELKTIQHKIEKQQIQHDLISEQLKNSLNEAQIQKLTNWILLASLLLAFSFGFILFYRLKNKKEAEALLQSIKYHKQQLLMFASDEQNLNDSNKKSSKEIKLEFNQQLVKTFVEAINIWEKHTGTNRVEFADKSKLWTISIDNGNLRTRSLDKYLTLDKLPKNPRWRSVVNSCHFILADPDLASKDRQSLSQQLESLMTIYKKLSLAS
jgi:tetratricopeptide (TPR) repeat protein